MAAHAVYLTDDEDLFEARRMFHRVFQSPHPLWAPFRYELQPRTMLTPVGSGFWDQFDALVTAAAAVGDDRAYYYDAWAYEGDNFSDYPCTVLSLQTGAGDDLRRAIRPIPTVGAFYSLQGTWGILSLPEGHALAAGPAPFIAALHRSFDLPAAIYTRLGERLARQVTHGVDIDWIPVVLEHLYGRQAARQMLWQFHEQHADVVNGLMAYLDDAK